MSLHQALEQTVAYQQALFAPVKGFADPKQLHRVAQRADDPVHCAIDGGWKPWLGSQRLTLVSVSEGLEETPSGRLVEGIMATIVEFYSDNLGHEVRKGMQQKLQNGGWPHLAPVGYVNVRVNGQRKAEAVLAVGPEQAPLVVRAFELYATGEHTLPSLHMEMAARGLRNKGGNP